MNARTKSVLIILATLLVGGVIGALATSAAFNNRLESLERLRRPGGFSERLLEVIQPTDEAQRAQLEALIEPVSIQLREISAQHRREMTVLIDSMHTQLEALLTPDQQERLRVWQAQRDRRGSGRGGGPPDGGRGDRGRDGSRP